MLSFVCLIAVCDLTRDVAQRAGGLLAKANLASDHAVDAFVVSTALEFDSAVIATGDPKDIKRLLGSWLRSRGLVGRPRIGRRRLDGFRHPRAEQVGAQHVQ
jgi:hypothetical protein